jgi:hypothetical protein
LPEKKEMFGLFPPRPSGVYIFVTDINLYLRPYRDEHTASRPIRAVKHRRGQRVLPWVTRREHCAAAGFLVANTTFLLPSRRREARVQGIVFGEEGKNV